MLFALSESVELHDWVTWNLLQYIWVLRQTNSFTEMHFLSINFICFNWVIPQNRLKRLIQTHCKSTETASLHSCIYGKMPVCETISFTQLKYMVDKLLKIYCWRLICCLFQHTQVPDIIEHAIDLGARRTDINKHFSTNLAQIGLCYTRLYTRTRSSC